MPVFLGVKEAALQTGKSPSSIRRIIYPIKDNDKHPDRAHIQPSVEEVAKLRANGENFAWRISEELLRRELPTEPAAAHRTPSPESRSGTSAETQLLSLLRGELEIKNQQIREYADLVSKLGERLHEGNVLMAGFQQRLGLTDGRGGNKSEDRHNNKPDGPVEVTPPASTPPPKASKVAAKPSKPKRGFFRRLFS